MGQDVTSLVEVKIPDKHSRHVALTKAIFHYAARRIRVKNYTTVPGTDKERKGEKENKGVHW